jgi:hypothetical protein
MFLSVAGMLSAQEPAQHPTAPDTSEREKKIEKREQSRRILGVLPEFTVTDRKNAPPLTPARKFRLFYKIAFDPAEFGIVGLQAALSQAQDSFPAYGQGVASYGKRYGAAFADQATSSFFANFFYPTVFKHDPRYFRLGTGSAKHRFGYALAQEFVGHKDKGGRSFNWSNTLGALSSGGISNAYYPAADRGLGLTMDRAAISLMYGCAGALASEFWPDIDRKLFHRHSNKPQLPPGYQAGK